MFNGTRFSFKVKYFITALSPAYILFVLQLNDKFSEKFKQLSFNLYGFNISSIYMLCGILVIFLGVLGINLKWNIQKQFESGSGREVTTEDLDNYKFSCISQKNGGLLAFLLGIVLPTIVIIETSIIQAIVIFLSLQLIIFILVIKSSDIFPNIILIILGVDICQMQNGNYILLLKGSNETPFKVRQLGNRYKSKLYITKFKK